MFKRWTSHCVNLLTSGIYLGLLSAGLFFTDQLSTDIIQQPLLALSLLALFAFAFNFWRLVDYKQSNTVFQLTDETDTCTVNPQGAEVIHMLNNTSYKHNH